MVHGLNDMSTAGTLYDETIKFGHGKLLQIATASGAASIAITGFDPTFDSYVIDLDNFYNVTEGQYLVMQVSYDSGATWKTTASYYWASFSSISNYTPPGIHWYSSLNLSEASWLRMSHGMTPGNALVARVRVFQNPVGYTHLTWHCGGWHSSYITHDWIGSGMWVGNVGLVNGVRWNFTSGTVSGTVRLYGMRTGA